MIAMLKKLTNSGAFIVGGLLALSILVVAKLANGAEASDTIDPGCTIDYPHKLCQAPFGNLNQCLSGPYITSPQADTIVTLMLADEMPGRTVAKMVSTVNCTDGITSVQNNIGPFFSCFGNSNLCTSTRELSEIVDRLNEICSNKQGTSFFNRFSNQYIYIDQILVQPNAITLCSRFS